MPDLPLVFLSHAHADAATARRLREWLVSHTGGMVECFLSCDRRSVHPGDPWPEAITRALDRAKIVLVLTTSAAERASWVAFEVGYATARKTTIVPLLAPGYDVTRLKPPLLLQHAIAVRTPDDLATVIELFNDRLRLERDTTTGPDDVMHLFSDARAHWHVDATPLPSRREMYAEIKSRVEAAKVHEHIQVMSTLPHQTSGIDEPFKAYIKAVARKCAEAIACDDVGDYTIVMAYRPEADGTPPPDRVEAIRYRQKVFDEFGALDRLTILQLDDSGLMNVMTIGYDGALIAFPGRRKDPHLRHAIWISSHEFVTLLNDWFEYCVRPRCRMVDPETLKVADHYGA